MSGYVNPVFRPDFMDYPAPPQNRLASGFNAIWPASNPVGTETTLGMQSATPVDQIAFMRPDGTPVMQSDLQRAHEQVQTAMQVAPTMALGMVGDAPGIRAFHGSPYDFERFDTSKIGTGEGAQAYGHGLYMAGNENVAQSYKMAGPAADAQVDAINQQLTQLSKQMDQYSAGQYGKYNDPKGYELKAQYDALMDKRAALGHMYEVNIGADPEQFLHWDKPLSEQSPQVQQALAKVAPEIAGGENIPGSLAYYRLAGKLTGNKSISSPEAAEALRDAGIPGIRYLDQGSRGAQDPIKLVGGKSYDPSDPTHLAANALDMSNGDRAAAASIAGRHAQLRAGQGDTAGADAMRQAATLLQSPRSVPPLTEGQPPGTHNYVVFDAATIDILRKYGLAGLGIGLGAAGAGTQQQSQ